MVLTPEGKNVATVSSKFGSNTRLAYLFLFPAFFVMGLVVFYPFIYNLVISFSNMNLTHFHDWHFKGFANYKLGTVLNLVFHVSIGVFLALILNKNLIGKSIFRTLLILPWAVPQYITALTWRGMFN